MAWNKTIEIDWSGETFEERRDATVKAISNSGWIEENGTLEFAVLVYDLAETYNEEEFDSLWDYIYDEADYDRVWITVKR